MRQRWFTLAGTAALAAAAMLLVADPAWAQRRGGGWRGGGWGGRGYDGGYYGRGWDGGYYGGGYWDGGLYGRGYYSQPYGSYGYNRGWYAPGYYRGDTDFYGDTFAGPQYSSTESTYGAARDADTNAAMIDIRVPPDAQIWFDGERTRQTGSVREFETPALDPGQTFSYEIRARWNENGRDVERTRHVTVRAGERKTVSFMDRGAYGDEGDDRRFDRDRDRTRDRDVDRDRTGERDRDLDRDRDRDRTRDRDADRDRDRDRTRDADRDRDNRSNRRPGSTPPATDRSNSQRESGVNDTPSNRTPNPKPPSP